MISLLWPWIQSLVSKLKSYKWLGLVKIKKKKKDLNIQLEGFSFQIRKKARIHTSALLSTKVQKALIREIRQEKEIKLIQTAKSKIIFFLVDDNFYV